MSFIIKGIDLPEGTDGLSITFHSQDGVIETHILDVTQAIQIPKGHGDIVDRDEIVIRRDVIDYRRRITGYCKAINDNPNILLEGEEE